MAFPATLLSNQWTDNESLNAAKMYARIDTNLNALGAALADTGWTTITLASGYTASGSDNPMFRIRNGVVFWKGTVAGSFAAGSTNVICTTVPAAACPTTTNDSVMMVAGQNGSVTARAYVSSSASTLTINIGGTAATSITLAGLSGYLAVGV